MFASAAAILAMASGCVGNPAATPVPPQITAGSDSASLPNRSASASPEPHAIAQYGTGRATIKGRVTYGADRAAALTSVGMLDSRNRETWVKTDINGWYAFTGVDLGAEYMLTYGANDVATRPQTPVVRHVTVTQDEMRVDAQVALPN
jgi:hypothetical protein